MTVSNTAKFGAAALACVIASSAAAEARIVRSGGQTGVSGQCGDDADAFGPVAGIFAEGGVGDVLVPINLGAEPSVDAIPITNCNLVHSYEFDAGDEFEFLAVLDGYTDLFYSVPQVESLFVWSLGGFVFETTNPLGRFAMPSALVSDQDATFTLELTATFTIAEGFELFNCAAGGFSCTELALGPNGENPVAQTQVYRSSALVTILGSDLAASPVPVPGAAVLMLTAMGGIAGTRRWRGATAS